MNGTELCCRFSRITNKLEYCGPKNAYQQFDYSQKTIELLKKFEGLFPYLQLIANKHKLDPFDYKVVEAYWLGNELLDVFTKEDMINFIPELAKRGLPQSIVQDIQNSMPKTAFPSHTFNVFFVGVGKITQSVSTTLENMNNCMVSWGTVLEVGEQILVDHIFVNEKYQLQNKQSKINKTLDCKPGDVIALHWNDACIVLTKEQQHNLKKYTEKIIAQLQAHDNS